MTSAVTTEPSATSKNVSHVMRRGIRSALNQRGGQRGEQNSWKVTDLLLATSTAVTQGLYFHMIDLYHFIALREECALENMSIP
jgi:hypothetical protein